MKIDNLKQRAEAFDHLFDSVIIIDSQGIITDWNKSSEKLYGYTKEQVTGQSLNMFYLPEDSDKFQSEVSAAMVKYGYWSDEIRMMHKDDFIVWIESQCIPLLDEDKQITGSLMINRDITQRKHETESDEYLAHYDQLTSIPNRHLLLSRLSHLITQSERNLRSFALLYIDLDNFKSINDSKGHAFGDLVLIEAAYRLKQSIRESDTVARVGSDEFVLILEEIPDDTKVAKMVVDLTKALNGTLVINDEEVEINCSIGVAIYPDDGTTIDDLLSSTDKAMLKTKNK